MFLKRMFSKRGGMFSKRGLQSVQNVDAEHAVHRMFLKQGEPCFENMTAMFWKHGGHVFKTWLQCFRNIGLPCFRNQWVSRFPKRTRNHVMAAVGVHVFKPQAVMFSKRGRPCFKNAAATF